MSANPDAPNAHCCDTMRSNVERRCEQHPDPYECPDNVVAYVARFREYGLIVHDGGSSYIAIGRAAALHP